VQPQEAKPRGAGSVTAIRPFQIRGRFFTAIALRLASRPDDEMLSALDAQLRQTPGFFAGAPLVLDLEHASDEVRGDDLVGLVEQLRRRKLSVFAVQNGTPEQTAAGVGAGLIALSGGRDVPSRPSGKEPHPVAAPAEAPPPENRLITTPVRSGQTVFADRGDLTVVGPVGSGAELLAAGSIHVYGQLRGRALAGVNGDQTARIFCHSLDAELLAIAGLYRTSESLGADVRRRSVQVFLQGEQLRVEPLEQNPTRDRSDP
jgi:septum site-determining protein MinC